MEEQIIQNKPLSYADRRDEALHYLSFLVWPFGVMVAALRHWEIPWSKNVFWIFCIFFGFTFVIAKNSPDSADSARIAQNLIHYAHTNMNLSELWRSFYSESSNNVDIVQPLLTFLVSRVTDNPIILFTIYALIFGYFYSRNIWLVLNKIKGNITFIVFIFIMTYVLINPIWNINGFRMYAAAQIFLFGTLSYFLEGKSRRLLWSVISVFFHFSFLFPLIILMLFFLLKNRTPVYLGFFILTAFIKEIDLQSVRTTLSFLPPIFQSRVEGYTSLGYAEVISSSNQSLSWFLPFSDKAITWVTYAMTLFIYFFGRRALNERKDLVTLFSFSLLLYGFANIFSLIPSGGRFLSVSNSFIFPFFIIFISTFTQIKGLNFVKVLSIPLLLLFCIVSLRLGAEFFSLMTIFGNPLIAAFFPESIPIISGIKGLL